MWYVKNLKQQLFVKEKMTGDEAYKFSRKIIDKAHREDGIVTLNWHQHTFSPEFKSWLKIYVQLLIKKYETPSRSLQTNLIN